MMLSLVHMLSILVCIIYIVGFADAFVITKNHHFLPSTSSTSLHVVDFFAGVSGVFSGVFFGTGVLFVNDVKKREEERVKREIQAETREEERLLRERRAETREKGFERRAVKSFVREGKAEEREVKRFAREEKAEERDVERFAREVERFAREGKAEERDEKRFAMEELRFLDEQKHVMKKRLSRAKWKKMFFVGDREEVKSAEQELGIWEARYAEVLKKASA